MRSTLGTATLLAALAAGSGHAGLVAHYEFEELGSVTTTADSTGNGHTGTLLGNATIVNDATRGNVLQLAGEGSADYVNIDSTVAIPNLGANSGLTLAAWVKRNDDATGGESFSAIIGLGASGNNPVMSIAVDGVNSNFVTGWVEGDGGSDQVKVVGDTSVVNLDWTHVAITYDRVNNQAITYVNGVAGPVVDISIVGDGELNWSNATIGKWLDAGNYFGGLIDDARIYDEVLSASAVAALVPEPGSLALLGLGGLLIGARRRRG